LSWSAESLNLLKNKCAVIGDDLEKLRHTVFSRHQSTVMVQLFLSIALGYPRFETAPLHL
jgi:hypothetical protein